MQNLFPNTMGHVFLSMLILKLFCPLTSANYGRHHQMQAAPQSESRNISSAPHGQKISFFGRPESVLLLMMCKGHIYNPSS